MIKLRSKRFSRSSSKLGCIGGGGATTNGGGGATGEIEWELRPGGMLVQKRECKESIDEIITIRVSTVSFCHDVSIQATSTFAARTKAVVQRQRKGRSPTFAHDWGKRQRQTSYVGGSGYQREEAARVDPYPDHN